MNIAFYWPFIHANKVFDNWRDGLRAAIEIIAKEHEVDWIIGQDKLPEAGKYDAIIFWDDSNSDFFKHFGDYKKEKIGLCLTTNPQNFENLNKLDVVYVESGPVYDQVRSHGMWALKAFGTDTNFYTPNNTNKDIENFYPATFSPWKRQRDLAELGGSLYCVGTIQPDGQEDYQAVCNSGATVEVGYFPPEHIRDLYRRANNVVIPAVHGSERTVLEAMACGIEPDVNPDNTRAYSYIKELEESGLSPRDFVVLNYSSEKYAKALLRGIL